jgi:hypothetical protein
MKFHKFSKLLCKMGIHKKKKVKKSGEVNWSILTIEVTECTICQKLF